MSTTPEKAEAEQGQQAALRAHLIATGVVEAPALSVRHLNEPCGKHGKTPPGSQSWNEDGSKKQDPNGFDHSCQDCLENAEIRLEA